MSLAKTPDSTVSTSRRTLGAGLFAIMAGSVITSGIAAGAAASVTDPIPPSPDAELIALCAEFDVLERHRQQACNTAVTMEEDAAADLVWTEVRRQQAPMLNRMCTLPCTTLAGLGALAASLVLWDSGEMDVQEDDVQGLTINRLTTAMLRAALAGRAAI